MIFFHTPIDFTDINIRRLDKELHEIKNQAESALEILTELQKNNPRISLENALQKTDLKYYVNNLGIKQANRIKGISKKIHFVRKDVIR